MEREGKRNAISLGVRIGAAFLAALLLIILVAYFVLSKNFHGLLQDYTVELMQSMVDQGVTTVEEELSASRREVVSLASLFEVPQPGAQAPQFPRMLGRIDALRAVYVSDEGAFSSDGRRTEVGARPDILAAYKGETAVYGPYFNQEGEYVICFSAPVLRGDEIAGVLSLEKDGYFFCELIAHIRFVNTGESYIINAEGTDIAVSDPAHIDWVNSQYNGRELLRQGEDAVTRSIVELEQKGLDGERGVGTYYWNDGLCYLAYAPIPSVGWVLLAGLREEEIAAMTQSALFAAVSQGPAPGICLALFLALTGLIVFWIVSSTKKNAEINEKLKIIANHDSLTGLLNRRFLETDLDKRWKYPIKLSGRAAVFMIDIDDFKKYNDRYGHPEGDECLRRIADVLKSAFAQDESYVLRYGGEEFAAVVFLLDRQAAMEKGKALCRLVEEENLSNGREGCVTVSVGIGYADKTGGMGLRDCIRVADTALYQAKREGKNRAVLLDAPGTEE